MPYHNLEERELKLKRVVKDWEAHHFLSFTCPFCGRENIDTDGRCTTRGCGTYLENLYAVKVKK
jgi:transcription elongation factor Elf1